ncbi:hypothetical protein PQX77_000726 [Marasmius sp. AFHP31]|nr:hypothetical protein PQX77_000726 [Marasmius sp. AFHP31]
MAPFYDAVKVFHERKSEDGGYDVYAGDIDGEWCIGSVPQGGYVFGLIIEACLQHQAQTRHRDPIHATAHFLRATSVAPFKVHIRKLREGKGLTNLVADLVQDDVTRVTTHQVFGVLSTTPNSPDSVLHIVPPSPYARRVPLYHHPSTAPVTPLPRVLQFRSRLKVTKEPELAAKNVPVDTNDSTSIGSGKFAWGQWLTFTDERQTLTPPALAFLTDSTNSPALLLPRSERTGLHASNWFPTVALMIEFKFPLSAFSSQRTVGLYMNSHFFNDPQGRHDFDVEVWSAPCDIGEGKFEEGWKEKQVCLAVSRQTALIVPMEVNASKANGKKNETAKL